MVLAVIVAITMPLTTEGIVQRVNYTLYNDVIITFDDGRSISLRGQPTRSIMPGKYYKITYNNFRYFYDVEKVKE